MAIANPLAAVCRLLLDNPEVSSWTEGRIYAAELPEAEAQGQPRRMVLVTQVPAPRDPGYVPVHGPQFDTKCYGKTPLEAQELDSIVYERLHYMNREIHGGGFIFYLQALTTGTPLRDPDGRWPYFQRSYASMIGEQVFA